MTGTNTFTATDLQYIIPEIWSPKVEREFEARLLAANFFTDKSAAMTRGGDTLNVTDVFTNTFSASTKATASEVTLVSPAQAQIQLAVNTWKEVSYLIEDKELVQILRDSDILAAYAEQAVYKLAKAYDTSLLALYSGLSQSVNDTASDVVDQDIRAALKALDNADVPLDTLAFYFHPTVTWDDLLGASKYTGVYDSDPVAKGMLGGMSKAQERAFRGQLYGVPVYATTNIQADGASSAYYNLLAGPRAFMHASMTPGAGRTRTQANYLPQNLGTLWTSDVIYGVAELRDAAAVVIKSRQTGVVS